MNRGVKVIDETHFRNKINVEREELALLSAVGIEARAPVELDQQSIGRLSRMDAMQQQSMDLAREERRRARLGVLAAALRRLDEGCFGDCLACGEKIAKARLEVDPAVTLCIDCQR
ncbi:TraR/DksA C4-type zinc finger protein [Alphaproteobacteria bacterium]|nr:TraR/DksA C4-type zinc finger protein [Alphaproteobacteria bacterium]